jgi:hypothetical protein
MHPWAAFPGRYAVHSEPFSKIARRLYEGARCVDKSSISRRHRLQWSRRPAHHPVEPGAAAGIPAVEAYHSGLVRSSIFIADPDGKAGLHGYTQKVAATRMALEGSSTTDDIGVGFQTVSQTGSTNYSRTYSRTTTQVLKIAIGSTTAPVSGAKYTGVFFPNGLNGLFS